MTKLAPLLETYFTTHLISVTGASSHTISSYRDTWRLLLGFVNDTKKLRPHQVRLADLDVTTITRFLTSLEDDRGNSIRTRNVRLAAIHSFFASIAIDHPDQAGLIAGVLAIGHKRDTHTDIDWLTDAEATAILAVIDQTTHTGRRDHVLILTGITTGLRVAELTTLTWANVNLGHPAYLECLGKGRKTRATPLAAEPVTALKAWKKELHPHPEGVVFPTRAGTRMSTDAVEQRLSKHVKAATQSTPSLTGKNITPHVLRHTTAMRMLHAGIDTAVIALWLGHESPETTQIYVHADLTIKEKALARTRAPQAATVRYKPDDALLAFLNSL